jgi:hypothetical protein
VRERRGSGNGGTTALPMPWRITVGRREENEENGETSRRTAGENMTAGRWDGSNEQHSGTTGGMNTRLYRILHYKNKLDETN